MANWASDPEAAATALIIDALDALRLGDRTLLVATGPAVLRSAAGRCHPTLWSRRVAPSAIVAPDPPPGPFASAILRLPKSRDEQLMTAHQCLGVLAPNGRLYVYGGNTEGIKSFDTALSELGPVTTVAARGHGRILEIQRCNLTDDLKPALSDWRQVLADPPGWITYPGLFAAGTADPGTSLLLSHVPAFPEDARILDFGCGPGAISAAIQSRQPSARLTSLDNDTVALAAAQENVKGASPLLGDSLDAVDSQQFEMIVSNPPLHAGFREDTSALHRLVAEAPTVLTGNGQLWLVVQRRIALDRALSDAFDTVGVVADDGRYRVWKAFGKKTTTPRPTGLKPRR